MPSIFLTLVRSMSFPNEWRGRGMGFITALNFSAAALAFASSLCLTGRASAMTVCGLLLLATFNLFIGLWGL